jgi:para-nitrobenzyl esterase
MGSYPDIGHALTAEKMADRRKVTAQFVRPWHFAGLMVGVLLATVPAPAQNGNGPIVRVDTGAVQTEVRNGVLSAKGIPFAAPPVGPLRWRAPQAAVAWSGVREARSFGHDCMQIPFSSDAAPLGATPAEDCLTLNVWAPPVKRSVKRPVMVWIYGGGFVNGGSSAPVYDGAAFARDGVVFVSFNYRLGRFGYFAHPALTTAAEGPLGNFGLMDQHAALRWVKRNIAAFGGDPGRVTIIGESAGGASVAHLMGAPAVRSLFDRAVIMSGGGRDSGALGGLRDMRVDVSNLPSAETIGVNFATANGIAGIGATTLAKLRALDADAIAKGVGIGELMRGPPPGPPTFTAPFIDGITVVGSTETLFRSGAIAKVPLIVGATSADLGFLSASSKEALFARFGSQARAARAAYDPTGTLPLPELTQRIAGDITMVEPARYLATRMAALGTPVWTYRFSYVAQSMRSENTTGALHATDIPFFFDNLRAKYEDRLVPADAKVARSAHRYLVSFVKNGDPNGTGGVRWPTVHSDDVSILNFASDGRTVGGADPRLAQLNLVASMATATVSPKMAPSDNPR